MNQNRFLSQVRQYAQLQRRYRLDFSPQVNELARLRARQIVADQPDETKHPAELEKLAQTLQNEFAPYQPRWSRDFRANAWEEEFEGGGQLHPAIS